MWKKTAEEKKRKQERQREREREGERKKEKEKEREIYTVDIDSECIFHVTFKKRTGSVGLKQTIQKTIAVVVLNSNTSPITARLVHVSTNLKTWVAVKLYRHSKEFSPKPSQLNRKLGLQ